MIRWIEVGKYLPGGWQYRLNLLQKIDHIMVILNSVQIVHTFQVVLEVIGTLPKSNGVEFMEVLFICPMAQHIFLGFFYENVICEVIIVVSWSSRHPLFCGK